MLGWNCWHLRCGLRVAAEEEVMLLLTFPLLLLLLLPMLLLLAGRLLFQPVRNYPNVELLWMMAPKMIRCVPVLELN
jgi:hypothetical protein